MKITYDEKILIFWFYCHFFELNFIFIHILIFIINDQVVIWRNHVDIFIDKDFFDVLHKDVERIDCWLKLFIIISKIFHIIINEFELCKEVFLHILIVDIEIVCFNIATKFFFNIVIVVKINRLNFRICCINIKFLIMNFIVRNIFKCVEKNFFTEKINDF